MPKTAKRIALILAALLAVLAAAVALFAATFNPNDYKPQLIRLVQERYGRTLAIPGDIRLRFFPQLAVDLGQVRVSDHRSTAEFASVDSLRLSLALLPLLSKQFVVDELRIDGLRAALRRDKNGATNIDDLLRKEAMFHLAEGFARSGEIERAIELGSDLANLDYGYKDIGTLLEEWQTRTAK